MFSAHLPLRISLRVDFSRVGVLALICCIGIAAAQVELPEVVVRAAKPKPPKPAAATHARAAPAHVRPAPARTAPQLTPAEQLAARTTALNQGLNTIYAPTGTAPTTISHNAIEALPQGENATVEKIVLQFPGVTQDSAASGSFHVRNEHANVQTRINGIMLPDGVSGFGTFLDTALIGNISLITGALPPQFGLRTSGVLDIWTRSDAFNNTGHYRRLRRQPGHVHAEHRIRRHRRTDAILCHRTFLREQYRAGKSDGELERDP